MPAPRSAIQMVSPAGSTAIGAFSPSLITFTLALSPFDGKNGKQAFYPLTLPLTVGPGSIAVAITVGANRTEGSEWRWPLIVGLLIGALMIALSIYLSYRFADRIAVLLGDAAMDVVIRLSSFILVCIGVQILWNGLSTLLRSLLTR